MDFASSASQRWKPQLEASSLKSCNSTFAEENGERYVFPLELKGKKFNILSTSSGGDLTEESLQKENVHHVFYAITSKIRLNVT